MGSCPKAVGELGRFSVADLLSAASNPLSSNDGESPNDLGGFAWFWGMLGDEDAESAMWIFQPAPSHGGATGADDGDPDETGGTARESMVRVFGDYSGMAPL